MTEQTDALTVYENRLAEALVALTYARFAAEAAGTDGARHLPWVGSAINITADALTYARAKPLDEIID